MCDKIDDNKIPKIKDEEDIPLQYSSEPVDTKLPNDDVSKLEQKTKLLGNMAKTYLKLNSVKLIKWCLITIVLMYFIDVILANIGWKNSELVTALFELLKYIVTAVLGFAFANGNKADEN